MENVPAKIEPAVTENATSQPPEPTLPLPDPAAKGPSRIQKLKNWYLARKKITIPITIAVFILLIAGLPLTRYKVAGLVIKRDFQLLVIDSTTNSPVSAANVTADSIVGVTDGNGQVTLSNLAVGKHEITISKTNYKTSDQNYLVPIKRQKAVPTVNLKATGRQVSVKIINYVTGQPLAKATIKAGNVDATTDKDGKALLVLPPIGSIQKAQLSLEGYLDSDINITVEPSDDKEVNTFKLVPAGSIYFMSKRTGRLDLMKSNIDGSDAKVVVAGTGVEQDFRTSLVPSADFKFIALQTKRVSTDPSAQLYLVDSDGELNKIDSGNAEFYIHGWSGHNLIYSLARNDLPNWQQGKYKLKSYDADSGKNTLLDQSAGTDVTTDLGEIYVLIAISGGNVTYAKNWTGYFYGASMEGKQHSLHSISVSGQNHRLVSSYDAQKYSLQYRQHSPNSFYVYQTDDDDTKNFFDYSVGGQLKPINIDDDKFYDSYPSYILSPNGRASAWSDLRDGKDVVLVGDADGANFKNIASLSDVGIYNWFGNDYLLLSKKNSELYIISAGGGEPIKITDYQSVNGAYRYY